MSTKSKHTSINSSRTILVGCLLGTLAACGGSPSGSGNDTAVQAQQKQIARSDKAAAVAARKAGACLPWSADSSYSAGEVVAFNGNNYTAVSDQIGGSGVDPTQANAWAASGSCTTASVSNVATTSAITPRLAAAPDTNPHDANFSPATLKFLHDNTGLNGEQWDNIMKLVNKPEQDSLDWPKFYGYCENIGDQRGYTMGIFGATTGGPNDDGPDGPALFTEYDALSGSSSPSVAGAFKRIGVHGSMKGAIIKITDSAKTFCGKINQLQSDPVWREAMWRTFYNVYIKYSITQAHNRGFTDALTIGAFVDTALNQGASGDSGSLEGVLSRSGSSHDEKTFMTAFYAQRSKIVDTNDYNQPPNGLHRVQEWSSLMNLGDWTLINVDSAVVKVTSWTMK